MNAQLYALEEQRNKLNELIPACIEGSGGDIIRNSLRRVNSNALLDPLINLGRLKAEKQGSNLIITRFNRDHMVGHINSCVQQGAVNPSDRFPTVNIWLQNSNTTDASYKDFHAYRFNNTNQRTRDFITNECLDISNMFALNLLFKDSETYGIGAFYHKPSHHIWITVHEHRMRISSVQETDTMNMYTLLLLQIQAVLAALYEQYFAKETLPLIEQAYNISKEVTTSCNSPRLKEVNDQISKLTSTINTKTAEEYLTEVLSFASKKAFDGEMNKLKKTLDIRRSEYDEQITRLNRIQSDIDGVFSKMNAPALSKEDLDRSLKLILNIPEVQMLRYDDRNNLFEFHIVGSLRIDPKLIEEKYIGDKDAYLFYSLIAQGKIKTYMGNVMKVKYVDDNSGYSGISHESFELPIDIPFVPNTHLAEFGCMGSSRDTISRARNRKDWAAVAMQCVESVCQLNLSDSPVRNRFETYYIKNGKPEEEFKVETQEGTFITWKAYLKAYRAAEKDGK